MILFKKCVINSIAFLIYGKISVLYWRQYPPLLVL